MSFFERSHGFQVNRGNFYAVTGDVNIEKTSSSSFSNAQTSGVQKSDPGGVSLYPSSANYNQPTTTINDCTFVSNTRQGEKGIDKLHSVAALEALHDSADSFPQPRCHPETRTEMLKDLQKWVLGSAGPAGRVLWLFGPAGAGKSAIMRTLSRQLQRAGQLGGCFFFKRSHPTRGNAKVLFVTIAYQLAISVPWLKGLISQVVEVDPSVIARSIKTQLQKLICGPCRMHPNQDPLTILIDGLDECEGQDVHLEILHAIRDSFTECPLPFRFIIASRPEAHIREMFESSIYHDVYRSFNVEQSFDDVKTYFLDEFARIHREHFRTMTTIPLPWPLPEVLDKLVWRSSGYFIYASIIIKFIDDKNYRPIERLAIIMKDQLETGSDSAFDTLDQLYINILSTVPIAKRPRLISILCALANFKFSPDGLDELLGLQIGDTRLFLRGLHSIFDVPSEERHWPPWSAISTHHASFYDFLGDSKRSQGFYVGGLNHRMGLACSILRLFAREFQDSQYGLEDPQCPLQQFPHFVASLPPSAELLPLIQSVNSEYICWLRKGPLETMLAWMRKIYPAPKDSIQLCEDHEYIRFIETAFQDNRLGPMSHSTFDAYPILLQSCGLLHFLCLSVLLELDNRSMTIRLIRLLLDVSWSDLRSIISCLRSIIGEDEKRLAGLCDYIQDRPLAGESFPWPSLSRDLARRCIQTGKDIHAGKLEDVSWGEIQFHTNWAIHVRLSPCCNELLHDIQSLHPSQLPQCNVEDIHHVLEWLQSFPDPPFEVITCWAQHLVEIQVTNGRNFNPDNAERAWKNHLDRVKKRREITIKLKRVSTNNMRDTMVASVAGQI